MKYAFMGLGMIGVGLCGVLFIGMFQSVTVNNETEYYVLKEAIEAAMLESVDYGCYSVTDTVGCGEVIKISEQKFVENFTRRFVKNISGDVSSYELEFYDIIESPPKASIVVKGITQNYSLVSEVGEDGDGVFTLTNGLNGILEYKSLDPSELETIKNQAQNKDNIIENKLNSAPVTVTNGAFVDDKSVENCGEGEICDSSEPGTETVDTNDNEAQPSDETDQTIDDRLNSAEEED